MKYILLLLITIAPCVAQEINVEEMPATDVLKYLNIDPNSVAFWKFKITFPCEKFGALKFTEIISGKENSKMSDPVLFGPAKVFEIEMFLSPFITTNSKTYRSIYYKLSADGKSGTSGIGAATSFEIHENWKAEWGPRIPMVFKSSSGDIVDTVSFISSDTPITK